MTAIASQDVEDFRSFVTRRWGLYFDNAKSNFLEDVLRQRVESNHQDSASAYMRALELRGAPTELRKIVESLTVTETFFLRNRDHFRALVETALPERIRARAPRRRLRLLSAGCASGEEPYSLAITLLEHFTELDPWDVQIKAVDINARMLEKAAEGTYSSWALRDTPAGIRQRYFRPQGRDFLIREDIRRRVSFEERNLSDSNHDLWLKDEFDVIFCRNVLMYFLPEAAKRVIAHATEALAPNGFLFLGHAETLRGLSQSFHLRHTHDTFYYQRQDLSSDGTGLASSQEAGFAAEPADTGAFLSGDSGVPWVDAIQRATERIAGLAADPTGKLSTPPPVPGDQRPPEFCRPAVWDLGLFTDLLRQERHAEALEHLQRLPPESVDDPDVRLLHAVLLTNAGQLREAEVICEALLSSNELNAGAHYLMALCREHAGDRPGAEVHDQTALYLDPGFAMPCFHLGLLNKRNDQPQEAQRHLEQAVALLSKEDSSRILLFGGGFGREALMQLCRSEIRAMGGS